MQKRPQDHLVEVPREPTSEMLAAGGPGAVLVWQAMLKAWVNRKPPGDEQSQLGPVYVE